MHSRNFSWILVVFLPSLALAQPKVMEPGPQSPQESLKCIKVRPGFTVELMAAEPLVMDPIAFAWGPDGKFWVVEMGDYPLGAGGKGKPGGRIKFLEKTKPFSGEPKATANAPYDKATVFLDNLGYPTGVFPWKKGVLVTCAPDIFYAEDTDGDGKADKIEKLFTGFGEGNQQHRVNGLVWGLDNWIYGANGDSGGIIKSLGPLTLPSPPRGEGKKPILPSPPGGRGAGGEGVDIRGRDFRIKPDEGLIEAQSGQTQFGRARDDWGNWFGNNNSNPMWHYVLDDHYLRRNPHLLPPDPRFSISVTPGAAPVYPISKPLPRFNSPQALNHFTSACSAIVYRDDLFGPEFENNTFVSEPVHNLIHREIMKPKGVTFTSQRAPDEQKSEFLASTDNWFRPTMIQTGPDGALWVADMYRYVIEHPQWIPVEWQKKLDLRAGHDKGRIYRIYPEGKKPRAIPRLDTLSTKELVTALDSPSGWQRDMAQMLLVKKKNGLSKKEAEVVFHLLMDQVEKAKDPRSRVQALCTFEAFGFGKDFLRVHLFRDSHPAVRRHAIRIGERFLAQDFIPKGILEKCLEDADPQVRMQLAYSLGEWDSPELGKLLAKLGKRDPNDPYLWAAVLSSVNKKNWPSFMAELTASGRDTPLPGPVMVNILRLANGLGTPGEKATLIAALAVAEKGKYTAYHFVNLADLLDALEQTNSSLPKMWKEGNQELRSALEKLTPIFTYARQVVADPKTPAYEKVLALPLLGRGLNQQKEDLQTLATLLGPQTPDDLQAAALASLGRTRQPAAPDLLMKQWKSFSPARRSQALDILLSRADWLQATLDAVEARKILPLEIDAVRRQRLLDHKKAEVRARAVKLLAETVSPDRQKLIDSYRPVLAMKGDKSRGAKIFAKVCASCHQLGGIGQQVGPDLASVGDKTPEGLLVAILDPNRAVEARYLNYTAVTKGGVNYSGLLETETSTSITLVDAQGKKHSILRKDLDEFFSSGKSAMPEGLEKDLPPPDMADLLAFLRSSFPALKRKIFEGNDPVLIQPNPEGAVRLLPSNGAIYGTSIVLEKKHGNLGYWSSADDHVIWTVAVKKAGKYTVWLNWACEDMSAGNTLVLQAGGEKLIHPVAGTGSWDVYRRAKIGSLRLPAGQIEISARSLGAIEGALIDLKEVLLAPEE